MAIFGSAIWYLWGKCSIINEQTFINLASLERHYFVDHLGGKD